MDVCETEPLPDTVAEHEPYGASKPPTGTDKENVIDDPDTVPDTLPRPVTFVLASVMVIEPENDDPDWVICQVIVPGPEESDALPLQVPFTFAGVEGSVGLELPPPPQAIETAASEMVTSKTWRSLARGRCPWLIS